MKLVKYIKYYCIYMVVFPAEGHIAFKYLGILTYKMYKDIKITSNNSRCKTQSDNNRKIERK